MKKFLTLLAALLVVFVFTINAEAEVKEKGFYLGGGVAYAWENLDDGGLGFDGKYVWGTGDLENIEYFVGTINATFHF